MLLKALSVILLFFLTPILSKDWQEDLDWSASRFNRRCINIPSNMTLCRQMNYTKMVLPNALNHETISEAVSQSAIWMQLVNSNCYQYTRLFLCTLFAPICFEEYTESIIIVKPCKNLCEATRTRCEPIMNRYSYKWPDMLNCSQFQEKNEGNLCVHIPDGTTTTPKPRESITAKKNNNNNFRPIIPDNKPSNFNSDCDKCVLSRKITKKELCSSSNSGSKSNFIIRAKILRLEGNKIITAKRRVLIGGRKLSKLTIDLIIPSSCSNINCKKQLRGMKILIGNKERRELKVDKIFESNKKKNNFNRKKLRNKCNSKKGSKGKKKKKNKKEDKRIRI